MLSSCFDSFIKPTSFEFVGGHTQLPHIEDLVEEAHIQPSSLYCQSVLAKEAQRWLFSWMNFIVSCSRFVSEWSTFLAQKIPIQNSNCSRVFPVPEERPWPFAAEKDSATALIAIVILDDDW